MALGFCRGSSGGPVPGGNRQTWQKSGRESESEARAVLKRERPTVEGGGREEEKGNSCHKPAREIPGLGCYSLRRNVRYLVI